MALRALKLLVSCVLFFTLAAPSAQACFGPKLFVAAGQTVAEEVLYALVTLYVEEKTGVESTFVAVDDNIEPLSLLSAEKADLVFLPASTANEDASFYIEGLPALFSGKRPREELQFTTVLPAISKLKRLVTREDVAKIVARVEAGESAMAVVRKFLMQRRWI